MVKAVEVKLSSRSQEMVSESVDDEVAVTVSPAGEKISKIAHKQDPGFLAVKRNAVLHVNFVARLIHWRSLNNMKMPWKFCYIVHIEAPWSENCDHSLPFCIVRFLK